ncbi:OprD family outer membrane porin [Endozoicomonas sp. OPT23]|uniref:OprD family outer membrane porin n=1 Tax=Endozoicomonas sp. OPT23 TaxID=2072845 RepID=UPI00189157BE|nr:OprD family outer membrane porin [Endozoicomonas sp. OPT23]
MKLFAKSALCAAVATSVFAASAQAETSSFDPSLELTYKNYYWKQKNKVDAEKGKPEYYRDSWVQALVADFDTGYINDSIGAVLTFGVANKIDVKGPSITNLGSNGNAISGFQQAYLKGKHSFGDVDVKAEYGVKKRGYELYGNSGSRILAASSYGADLSAEYKDLKVYGARITGASNRNQSAFQRDLEIDGKKTNVVLVGANYKIAGVGLTGEHLIVKDYLKKNFVKADYTFDLGGDLKLATDVRYGQAKDGGSLLAGSDYKSSFINTNATLKKGDLFVGVGYNTVSDGDWNDGVGGRGNAGSYPSSASQWNDYNKEGSKTYILTTGYNFAGVGVPGLSADMTFAVSKDAKNYTDYKGRDFISYVSYKFDGQLKGLSLAWLHAQDNYEGTAKSGKEDDNIKSRDRSNRFYLKYTKAIF